MNSSLEIWFGNIPEIVLSSLFPSGCFPQRKDTVVPGTEVREVLQRRQSALPPKG